MIHSCWPGQGMHAALGVCLPCSSLLTTYTLHLANAGILRNVVDVIKMLAGGALAGQSVVLAASLLQDSGSTQEQQPGSSSGGSSRSGNAVARFLAGAKQLLLPTSLVEARVLAIVGVTRFLLLPALTLAGAHRHLLGQQRGWDRRGLQRRLPADAFNGQPGCLADTPVLAHGLNNPCSEASQGFLCHPTLPLQAWWACSAGACCLLRWPPTPCCCWCCWRAA